MEQTVYALLDAHPEIATDMNVAALHAAIHMGAPRQKNSKEKELQALADQLCIPKTWACRAGSQELYKFFQKLQQPLRCREIIARLRLESGMSVRVRIEGTESVHLIVEILFREGKLVLSGRRNPLSVTHIVEVTGS